MTALRHNGGEPVNLDGLTASTITDDVLDTTRAELQHYRAKDATGRAAARQLRSRGEEPGRRGL
ncbi:hypothetical protein [Streptomyces sp. x-80]|uniref:hypothetical protein n=1 Tax=Streptomyces sp. x-80 TaxID=2789282 RepID=UPI0039800E63